MSFNSIKASFVFNTIKGILDKHCEVCDCLINCRVINTIDVEVQKRMKSIAREVHLPSVVQSEFYDFIQIKV